MVSENGNEMVTVRAVVSLRELPVGCRSRVQTPLQLDPVSMTNDVCGHALMSHACVEYAAYRDQKGQIRKLRAPVRQRSAQGCNPVILLRR